MSFGLTRKTDYALVILAVLAEKSDSRATPISARLIADTHRLPHPLTMNLLKSLQRAGIVKSLRGSTGGYYLDCQPEKISLLQIIEAIEGPAHTAACCEPLSGAGKRKKRECRPYPTCPILKSMQRLDSNVREFFRSVSLQKLID